MKKVFALVLLSLLAAGAGATVAVGDTLPAVTLHDQHGQPAPLDDGVRVLLFSRDMKANRLAKAVLQPKAADYLPGVHAMYAIDVSGMPGFVTRNFALPKMRKYAFRIFVDSDASATANLPSQKGRITVLHLDHLKVQRIEYADKAADIAAALAQP
ncbi:MAG: hypothetical protein AB7O21_17695 [Gammaproteobacteria bacterium]